MKRLLLALSLFTLASCKEEAANRPDPVELTPDAVGYYCQMELLEHVGPKGQIHLDGMPAPIFFSQVKDTVAYLHMPEQSHAVRAIYVQDMAGITDWARPGAWIPVENAVYVIGSDRFGGMGAPEFVPFSDREAARAFAARHGGELRQFDQIGPEDVLAPVAELPSETDEITARLNALKTDSGRN
ncbi:nitrous oxide reductase accessory protein NosL [Halovulum sp. GXIMD14794]